MSLHDMAVRLCEGGHVWVEGHYVGAREIPYVKFACYECEMDSICHFGEPMCNLCHECDLYTDTQHILYLVAKR